MSKLSFISAQNQNASPKKSSYFFNCERQFYTASFRKEYRSIIGRFTNPLPPPRPPLELSANFFASFSFERSLQYNFSSPPPKKNNNKYLQ